MQTNSSKYFSVAFPPELLEKLREFAASESMSVPYVIRHACIEHLSSHGFDVSSIPNPVSRGERTDLVDAPPAKLAALRRQAARARAAKESRAAAPSVPSAASKPRSRAHSAA